MFIFLLEIVVNCQHVDNQKIKRMKKILIPLFLVSLYFIVYFYMLQPPSQDHLKQLYLATSSSLYQLIQTKYFRIIRLNLNQQCPISLSNRLCKSQSCRVCRCDSKEIPSIWIKNDQITSKVWGQGWSTQRVSSKQWIWHVEDQQNDNGEYFDIFSNVQAFTNYNGTFIWKLIYQQNCFAGRYEQLCNEEQILYKIISGLHTSISTHLSAYYSPPVAPGMEWMVKDPTFKFNYAQYNKRVLNHTDRINNLFFLYEVLAKAIKEIAPELISNYTIQSDNTTDDLQATKYLRQVLQVMNNSQEFLLREKETLKFFSRENPKVKQYQRYIHNISSIMNCVDCQKCKVFGKMQTYGVGTALKILLGYKQPYKRNEIVALFNLFNKITISIGYFYQHQKPDVQLSHLKSSSNQTSFFYFIFGGIIAAVFLFYQISSSYKKQFKPSFPPSKDIKLN